MIDLHAHVLPGVDDGPADLAEAVAVARAIAASGATAVAATSHVSDRYPNRPDGLASARAALQAALAAEGVELTVLPGAEVALEQVAALDDATLDALKLGGGPYLLLEAPLSPAFVDAATAVRRVLDRGHRVVLAHPERAPCFQRDHEQLVGLVADGVLTSITAGAVLGRFGRTAAAAARRMLEDEVVHDIASDAHDLAGRRPGLDVPELGQAGRWLVSEAPAAILRGDPPGLPPVRVELAPAVRSDPPVWRRVLRLGRAGGSRH